MAKKESYPYFVRARVVALRTVTESGYPLDHKDAPPDDFIHALKGDLGTVRHIETGMGEPFPTVFFDTSGTGTRVQPDEITLQVTQIPKALPPVTRDEKYFKKV